MDDDTEGPPPTLGVDFEVEVKEMMGLFDTPAFARRGHDLEITLRRLDDRCRAARPLLLDMVQLRLRQWARAVTGPEAWSMVFARSIEPLWAFAEAQEADWAKSPVSIRRQRIIAADLITATARFNRRWQRFLEQLRLEPINDVIEQYNRYYVIEKECVMGSARLAARHFQPMARVTISTLATQHPFLPVPELRESGAANATRSASLPDDT